MIFNWILLFTVIWYKVRSHNITEVENAFLQPSLRMASIELMEIEKSIIQFILYESPTDEGTHILHVDKEDFKSNVKLQNANRKTYVLFNGHPTSDSLEPFQELRVALLTEPEINVVFILIDWTKHDITFSDSLLLSQAFGKLSAEQLYQFEVDPQNLHFIAHCAGTEVAAAAAANLYYLRRKKVARITSFDPYISRMRTQIQSTQPFADFIDIHHAGIYDPIYAPIGSVDFYPNAGIKQPGCSQDEGEVSFTCHHRRSIYLYIESMSVPVYGIEANFNDSSKTLQVANEKEPRLALYGHNADPKVRGAFYLPTFGESPFLMNYFRTVMDVVK